MVDFVALAATAARLITENGRSVTFVALDETPAAPGQPWLGTPDPRAVPEATLVLNAAFVEPSSVVRLGLAFETSDFIKRADQIMIVAPGTNDLEDFDEVQDSGTTWKIGDVRVLRPASTTVLAFVSVAR